MSSSTSATISGYFQSIQFRGAPSSELDTYSNLVNQGVMTLAQVREAIIDDPYTTNNVDPVVRLYQAAFGRVPESASAIDFYADRLADGRINLTTIAENFANSPEFSARYSSTATSAPNGAYITALYLNVLDRAPSALELSWYLNSGMSTAVMLRNFSQSPEFQARSGDAVEALLNANALGTAVFSGPLQIEVPGQTFVLTTGIDIRPGTEGNDTFSGVVGTSLAATDGTTLNPGDNLVGGAGADTLAVTVTGSHAAGGLTNSGFTLTGIETVAVSNFESSANLTTLDLSLAPDVSTVRLASSGDNGDTAFTGVRSMVAAEMNNGGGDLTVTYVNTAVAGSADTQSLALSGVTGGTFAVGPTSGAEGVETISITSSGGARNVLTGITDNADTRTITVAGNTALTLGTVGASVTRLDASANTGGLTATLSSTATAAIIGSAGNDAFTTGTVLTTGSVNAGAGVDALTVTADGVANSTTLGARYTNFETLNISHANHTPGTFEDRAQDVSLVAGITSVGVTAYTLAGSGADDTDTVAAVNFTNLGSATKNLNISGLSYSEPTDAHNDDVTVTVSATLAANTAADDITVTLGTATAAAGNAAAATTGDDLLLAVNVGQFETVNVVSQGGANTITTLTAGSLRTLNASGAQNLTITTLDSNTEMSVINASAMTGALSIGTNNSTTASTITGGSGSDSLVGGTRADSISGGLGNDVIIGADGNDVLEGGAGNDSITAGAGVDRVDGGEGDDTFSVTAVGDFIGLTAAETVIGGAGNDILAFAENTAITLTADDLAGLSGIERISLDGDANTGSVTLTDATYTANGVATLRIIDADLVQGALVVDGSRLTGTNAIHVTANTTTAVNDSLVGGAGNDTFVFATAAGLESTDTVTGGAGTDVISLTATAAVTANLSNVRTVEQITTTGNGGDVTIVVGSDNVLAASATLTVNASSVTNSIHDLNYDGAAITTATKSQNVTGTAGNDTIVGGSGNDIVVGGDGADAITGGAGIDNLSGGAGDDVFNVATLGAGFVSLASAETVSGGTGNDTLSIAAGTLTVQASDLLGLSSIENIEVLNTTQDASITLTDAVFSANGATTLRINANAATTGAITVSAASLSAANSVTVSVNATNNSGTNNIALGAGNDRVIVDNVALDNGTGATTIAGGAGNDTLEIVANGGGAITVAAGVTGFETVQFSAAAGTYALVTNDANVAAGVTQTVNGTALTGTLNWDGSAELDGRFSITTGSGNDTLTGGALGDTIIGGSGADRITGNNGADVLTGGIGADTFVYTAVAQSSGTNVDSITDFVSGTDKLEITLSYAGSNANLDINATRVSAGVAGQTLAQDALSGQRGQYIYDTSSGQLYVNVNNDNLITTSDYRIGINAAATASATIAEGDINFVITGGNVADTITAGAGADTINGGAGADSITGGAGDDVFIIAAAADHASGESIAGGAGSDTIRFTSTTAGETLTLLAGVTDSDNVITVVIGDAAGATTGTTALNVNANALGDTLAVHLTGNSGANNLTGNATADTINAGAGNDTVVGGHGGDAINVGAGTDTISFASLDDSSKVAKANAVSGTVTISSAYDIVTGMGTGDIISVAGIFPTDITIGNALLASTVAADAAAIVRGKYDSVAGTWAAGTTDATFNDYLLQVSDGTSIMSVLMVDIVGTVSFADNSGVFTLTVA